MKLSCIKFSGGKSYFHSHLLIFPIQCSTESLLRSLSLFFLSASLFLSLPQCLLLSLFLLFLYRISVTLSLSPFSSTLSVSVSSYSLTPLISLNLLSVCGSVSDIFLLFLFLSVSVILFLSQSLPVSYYYRHTLSYSFLLFSLRFHLCHQDNTFIVIIP